MLKIKSKLETAREIAKAHFEIEPEMRRIFLLEPVGEKDVREPIKLLEVMDGAIERGIEPVSFPALPAQGISYPSMIVELSPKEFSQIDPNRIQFRTFCWTLAEELSR